MMKNWRRLLPYFLLGAIVCFLFQGVFLRGYVLDGHVDRKNLTLPFQFYYLRSFQQFQIPQWNPYIFCGKSGLAQAGLTFFYPLSWIVYLFPEYILPLALTISAMIYFFLAGVFMYHFLRKITSDRYWSLCGTFVYWLALPVVTTMAQGTAFFAPFLYLPLLTYLLYTFSERSILANILTHSLVLSLLLLGGFIQSTIYILGIYLFLAIFLGPSPSKILQLRVQQWLTAMISLVLAGAIAAIRYLPFYARMRLYLKDTATYSEFLEAGITPPLAMLKIFLPQFFGGSWGKMIVAPFLLKLNPNEMFLSYGGVFGIFLSAYAFCFLWKKGMFVWKLAVCGILLIVLGSPLAYGHYLVTGRTIAFFGRVAWLLPFVLSILFCEAGKAILQDRQHVLRCIVCTVCIMGLVLILGMVIYMTLEAKQKLDQASLVIMQASGLYFVSLSGVLILLLLVVMISKTSNTQVIFKVIFLIFLVADLIYINIGNFQSRAALSGIKEFLSPLPLFETNTAQIPIISEFSWQRNFRIVAQGENTILDRSIVSGLYQISGYDNTLPNLIARLYLYPESPSGRRFRLSLPQNFRVMQLAAAKYIVDDEKITSLPSPLPRFKLYTQYQVIADEEQALQNLFNESFDFHSQVILAEPPDLRIKSEALAGTAQLIEESYSTLVFDVTTEHNSLLVVNDTYDDGWNVRINKEPARVLRANYTFRAVAVPKGSHRIEFQFVHPGLREGKLLTLIAIVIWLCLLGFTQINLLSPTAVVARRESV